MVVKIFNQALNTYFHFLSQGIFADKSNRLASTDWQYWRLCWNGVWGFYSRLLVLYSENN